MAERARHPEWPVYYNGPTDWIPLVATGTGHTALISGWAALRGAEILDVRPHYQLRDEYVGSYWCPRTTIAFPPATVDLLLGDAEPSQQLVPSADNIAERRATVPITPCSARIAACACR